jgi:hypothetical protein
VSRPPATSNGGRLTVSRPPATSNCSQLHTAPIRPGRVSRACRGRGATGRLNAAALRPAARRPSPSLQPWPVGSRGGAGGGGGPAKNRNFVTAGAPMNQVGPAAAAGKPARLKCVYYGKDAFNTSLRVEVHASDMLVRSLASPAAGPAKVPRPFQTATPCLPLQKVPREN